MHLASGSSTWSPIGSSASQANLSPVDGREVLRQLADVPVHARNYPSQDPAVRHIGPAVEYFNTAFGVGDNDRAISTVDADGVALAAFQGLYEISQAQAGRIEALEAENAAQQEQIDDLEVRLAALESRTDAPASQPFRVPSGWLLLGGLVLVTGVVVQRRLPGGDR